MLELQLSNQFKKDIKKLQKSGNNDFEEFNKVLKLLCQQIILPLKYKNHKLSGKYKEYFDCHIKDNWILIYKIDNNVLKLARTGTHNDVLGI